MMNSRDTCIFYRSMYEAIKELPKEIQADIYNAIFSYSLDFTELELTGIQKTVWTLIRPVLEKGNTNFINGNKPKRSEIEAKPKRLASEPEANDKPIVSEPEAYKDKDKDKDEYKDKDEKKNAVVETLKPKQPRKKNETAPEYYFTETPEGMNANVFIEKWNETNFAELHKQIDPFILWGTMRDWSNENSPTKNKRSDWMAVGRTFVKKDPKQFTKTIIPHGAIDHLNTADRKTAEMRAAYHAKLDAMYPDQH